MGRRLDHSYIQLYDVPVRFTWDPRKSERNLRKRGFDFAYAARILERRTLEQVDTRRDYGERRVVALGAVVDIGLTVVYTDRAGADGVTERRIISARVSSRHERTIYQQITDQA